MPEPVLLNRDGLIWLLLILAEFIILWIKFCLFLSCLYSENYYCIHVHVCHVEICTFSIAGIIFAIVCVLPVPGAPSSK